MRGLVVCALVAGCYHEPASAPPAHNAAPLLQQHSYSAALADPLGFLPIDSELVFTLDARLVRSSALWQHYSPTLLAKIRTRLDAVKRTCDLDPISEISRISVGLRGLGEPHPSGVIVIHGLDRAKILACAAKRPPGHDIVVDGDTFVMHGGDASEDVALQLVAEHTAVMVAGPGVDGRAVRAVLDAGSPLRGSPAFTAMFEHVDIHQAAWFVMNGNAKVLDKMTSLGFRPRGMYAWLSLGDGVAATLHIALDSAAQAQQLATSAQGQLGVIKPMVDAIDLVADDVDLVLTVAISDSKLQTLLGLSSGLFP